MKKLFVGFLMLSSVSAYSSGNPVTVSLSGLHRGFGQMTETFTMDNGPSLVDFIIGSKGCYRSTVKIPNKDYSNFAAPIEEIMGQHFEVFNLDPRRGYDLVLGNVKQNKSIVKFQYKIIYDTIDLSAVDKMTVSLSKCEK